MSQGVFESINPESRQTCSKSNVKGKVFPLSKGPQQLNNKARGLREQREFLTILPTECILKFIFMFHVRFLFIQ